MILIVTVILMTTILTVLRNDATAHEHGSQVHQSNPSEVQEQVPPDTSMQKRMSEHITMESLDAFPNYHPLAVHFPIVLLGLALLFQILSFFVFKEEFSMATLIILFLGSLGAWLASNTFHADVGSLPADVFALFKSHELLAQYTCWLSALALLLKVISHFFLRRRLSMELIVLVVLSASALTVSLAGERGAMLVHLHGVGPVGHHVIPETGE